MNTIYELDIASIVQRTCKALTAIASPSMSGNVGIDDIRVESAN